MDCFRFCGILLFSSDLASITNHVTWVLSFLWFRPFISFWSCFPHPVSATLLFLLTRGSSHQYPIVFSYVLRCSEGTGSCVPFSVDPFCRASHMTLPVFPDVLQAPASFIELDCTLWSVWSNGCYLWLWFQCILPSSAPSHTALTVFTWVSLHECWSISLRPPWRAAAVAHEQRVSAPLTLNVEWLLGLTATVKSLLLKVVPGKYF